MTATSARPLPPAGAGVGGAGFPAQPFGIMPTVPTHFGTVPAQLAPAAPRTLTAANGAIVAVPQVPQSFVPSTLQAEVLACTVYVTKIPRRMEEARLRGMFAQFGELNKVRIYEGAGPGQQSLGRGSGHGNRRAAQPADWSASPASGDAIAAEPSSFGFVEFAMSSSARLMIEHLDRTSVSLHRLAGGRGHLWTTNRQDEGEVVAVSSLRCSAARSAIHDHDARDAIYHPGSGRARECVFGHNLPTAPPGARPDGVVDAQQGGLNAIGLSVAAAPWGLSGATMMPTAAAAIAASQYDRDRAAIAEKAARDAAEAHAHRSSDNSFTVTSGDTSLADAAPTTW
jgi:hypothetical protein